MHFIEIVIVYNHILIAILLLFLKIELMIIQHRFTEVMAWCLMVDKPLPEWMMTQFTEGYLHHQVFQSPVCYTWMNSTSSWKVPSYL